MMQIDTAVLVTVVIFVLSVIGTLLGIIYKLHTGRMASLEARVTSTEQKVANETTDRNKEHKDSFARVYGRVEALEKKIHDVELSYYKDLGDVETAVASFGSTYATRRELDELRKECRG